jgi:hypothetical protein
MLQLPITNYQLPMNYQLSIISEAANGKSPIANTLKIENCKLQIEATERSAR